MLTLSQKSLLETLTPKEIKNFPFFMPNCDIF